MTFLKLFITQFYLSRRTGPTACFYVPRRFKLYRQRDRRRQADSHRQKETLRQNEKERRNREMIENKFKAEQKEGKKEKKKKKKRRKKECISDLPTNQQTNRRTQLCLTWTRPSRPIRCDVLIVERMRYRPTNRRTASYRGALSHLKRFKNWYLKKYW